MLVHGWGGSFASTWQATGWEALLQDAGRRVIGVDLLGHGTAPKPHDPDEYGDLTARLREAIDGEATVDAVGFSLGAATCSSWRADEPARFGRIVVGGVGANLFRVDPDGLARIVAAVEGGGDESDVRSQLFAQYARQPGNDPLALSAALRRPTRRALTPERLGAVQVPVLVAIGEQRLRGAR